MYREGNPERLALSTNKSPWHNTKGDLFNLPQQIICDRWWFQLYGDRYISVTL
jgi:hypothetical protein